MNTHENFDREEAPKGSSDKIFGLVIGLVFILIGLWPLLAGKPPLWWSFGLSGIMVVLAMVRPTVLGPFNRLWTKFGELLSKIVNPVLLGFIFYGVVTPIGWILRLFQKNPLNLKWDAQAKSYWVERQPPGPKPKSMIHPF